MPKTHPDAEFRKGFAARLKALRKEKSWTQKELAERLDLQLLQIVRYEAGQQMPPAETLVELSEILERTTDYLLTGDNTEAAPIHNLRLRDRMRALEDVAPKLRETIIELIDAVLVRDRVEAAVRPVEASADRQLPKRRAARKVAAAE